MIMNRGTVFGPDEVAAWECALDSNRPREVGSDEWFDFPQVESFAPVALNAGMVFRLAGRKGEIIDLVINPVAARHLAACILTMGQQAGWLDNEATVVCPPLGLDS
jgi:hypothetical protein